MATPNGAGRKSLVDWFGGQPYKVQASVLEQLADIHGSTEERIRKLERELTYLRSGETGTKVTAKAVPRKIAKATTKGTKVAPKYRDKEGNTWAGRGVQPVWLREKIKKGAKLESFLIKK